MMGQSAYKFGGDPHEIFERFFGTSNPNNINLDENGSQIQMIERIESDLHKDAIVGRENTHAPDLHVTVYCTLQEFFHGSTKTVFFTRQEVKGDRMSTMKQGDQKEIEIKAGMKAGHVFHFVDEGNLTAL